MNMEYQKLMRARTGKKTLFFRSSSSGFSGIGISTLFIQVAKTS